MSVQNLEKNYRDFQFRVTHLDPVIESKTYQREKSSASIHMQKEPVSRCGNPTNTVKNNLRSALDFTVACIITVA